MDKKKKSVFRYIIAFISVLAIIYMGSDINTSNYSKENAITLIVTSIVVSLIKAIIIFIGIAFLNKIVNKIKNKK